MINIFIDNTIICLILAIDVFLIGFNYGVSKVKIPFVSIVCITLINFIVIGFGVVFSFFPLFRYLLQIFHFVCEKSF